MPRFLCGSLPHDGRRLHRQALHVLTRGSDSTSYSIEAHAAVEFNRLAHRHHFCYRHLMTPTCQAFVVFQYLFPILFIMNFARCITSRGFMWSALAGLTSYYIFCLVTPLLLGTIGYLGIPYYRGVYVTIAAILFFRAIFCIGPLLHAVISIRYSPRLVDLLIAASVYLLGLNIVAQIGGDLMGGPTEFDAHAYHIPRALMWSWNGSFQPYATAIWQQIGSAYGGSAALLPIVFLGCGFLGASWTGTVFAFGAAMGIYVIGRTFNLSRRACILASLAFLSFPPVGMRAQGISSDIAATFPVIAGVAFFRSASNPGNGFFQFISLMGAGIASKQYAAFSGGFLGLIFLLQHWREFISQRVIWVRCALGVALSAGLIALSYYPVYRTFGDLVGGAPGLEHSVVGNFVSAGTVSFGYTITHWLSEPLSLLPPESTAAWFDRLGFPRIYGWFNIVSNSDLLPRFNRNEGRSGLLPLIALPWLLLGVKKGYRWRTFGAFILLLAIQIAPIKINLTGRFIIVPLGAFALLWGARAERWRLTVAILVTLAFFTDRHYLGVTGWVPHSPSRYTPGWPECYDLNPLVKDDTLLVVARGLSNDSYIAGRAEQMRFQYVTCPQDTDWVQHLAALGKNYRWLIFSTNENRWTPGPYFESRLFKKCSPIEADELRGWLTAAGWTFKMKGCGLHEVWVRE